MLERFSWLIQGLVVFPERMRRNLDASFGLYFSQRLLLALVAAGLSRDDAYRIVQRDAMQAWDTETAFRALVEADAEVTAALDGDALAAVFDPEAYLAHVDVVFERLDAVIAKEEGK
jgi:adenylosuccinate lyase